ncbi:hypothetical protein ACP70R_024878 [Stipagrostis hirtigluma subsp. patula]
MEQDHHVRTAEVTCIGGRRSRSTSRPVATPGVSRYSYRA